MASGEISTAGLGRLLWGGSGRAVAVGENENPGEQEGQAREGPGCKTRRFRREYRLADRLAYGLLGTCKRRGGGKKGKEET